MKRKDNQYHSFRNLQGSHSQNRAQTRYFKSHTNNQYNKSEIIQPIDIYFNDEKRTNHVKNIIDTYFEIVTPDSIINKRKSHSQNQFNTTNKFIIKKKSNYNKKNISNLSITYPKGFQTNAQQPNEMIKTFLNNDQSLPPILEILDDPVIQKPFQIGLSSLIIQNSQMDSKSATIESMINLNKLRPKLIKQNQLCKLYYLYQNKIPISVKKQYKAQCKQIYHREQNIADTLNILKIQNIWNSSGQLCFTSKYLPNIKSLLYQTLKQSVKAEQFYKITVKPYYNIIFMNDNQILVNMIKQICQMLVKIKGKIINNQISIQTVYMLGDYYVLGGWAHSAIKQTITIGKQVINSVMNPIIKGNNEWFAIPEYLPPQLLQYVIGLNDYNMWQYPSSVDMWSLGCMIFEIVTLVPLWMPLRCLLNHKRRVFRRGLFYSKTRDIQQIISKQKKFCTNFMMHFQKLDELQGHVNFRIIQLLKKMLDPNYRTRLTPQQAIKILS